MGHEVVIKCDKVIVRGGDVEIERADGGIVVVDASGHLSTDLEEVQRMFDEPVAAVIRCEAAGMEFDTEDPDSLERDIQEFAEALEKALEEAAAKAVECGASAVVLIPHGASFAHAAIAIGGHPWRGIPLKIAAYDLETGKYVLVDVTRIRPRP